MLPIIHIENLSKQYRLGQVGTGTLSHDLNRWWARVRGKEDPYLKIGETNVRNSRGDSEYVWALKDINLDIMQGEVVGIIGKNGAGKSTLLKILSKVTGPTTGRIDFNGRIGSLLEVGTGFHPELTGRENIYLNGAILGMTKAEIRSKLDEIIDFSGCERYIDTPVKRYSSGMMVRLGFAVAAHLEPEILVVDEVLAVGDAEFQKKAIGKMHEVSEEHGRTVLFVSHSMPAISQLTKRCILVDQGEVLEDNTTDIVVEKYLGRNLVTSGRATEKDIAEKCDGAIKRHNPTIKVLGVELMDIHKKVRSSFVSDEEIIVSVIYECIKEIHDLRVVVSIVDQQNNNIYTTQNVDDSTISCHHVSGIYHAYCTIPPDTFGGKTYYITIQLINCKTEHIVLSHILTFDVLFKGFHANQYGTLPNSFIRPKLKWNILKKEK